MLQLHPIAVRLVAVLVLVAGLGVAATSYLASVGRAQDHTAVSHVRAAVAAAEAWYQDPFGGAGSYRRLDTAGLIREAPSVSPRVQVLVLANGAAYCLFEEQAAGHSAYYVGGEVDRIRHLADVDTGAATVDHSKAGGGAAAVCHALS